MDIQDQKQMNASINASEISKKKTKPASGPDMKVQAKSKQTSVNSKLKNLVESNASDEDNLKNLKKESIVDINSIPVEDVAVKTNLNFIEKNSRERNKQERSFADAVNQSAVGSVQAKEKLYTEITEAYRIKMEHHLKDLSSSKRIFSNSTFYQNVLYGLNEYTKIGARTTILDRLSANKELLKKVDKYIKERDGKKFTDNGKIRLDFMKSLRNDLLTERIDLISNVNKVKSNAEKRKDTDSFSEASAHVAAKFIMTGYLAEGGSEEIRRIIDGLFVYQEALSNGTELDTKTRTDLLRNITKYLKKYPYNPKEPDPAMKKCTFAVQTLHEMILKDSKGIIAYTNDFGTRITSHNKLNLNEQDVRKEQEHKLKNKELSFERIDICFNAMVRNMAEEKFSKTENGTFYIHKRTDEEKEFVNEHKLLSTDYYSETGMSEEEQIIEKMHNYLYVQQQYVSNLVGFYTKSRSVMLNPKNYEMIYGINDERSASMVAFNYEHAIEAEVYRQMLENMKQDKTIQEYSKKWQKEIGDNLSFMCLEDGKHRKVSLKEMDEFVTKYKDLNIDNYLRSHGADKKKKWSRFTGMS